MVSGAKRALFSGGSTYPPKEISSAGAAKSGVMWNKTGRALRAPFDIKTSAGSDYYIKLVDAETNDDAMAIYVVGGQDLEVLVPPGSYKMRYAYGKIWRGEQHLFGPGELTRAEEALKSLDFLASWSGFNGYTVELIPQIDGNFPNPAHCARRFLRLQWRRLILPSLFAFDNLPLTSLTQEEYNRHGVIWVG